MPPPPSMAIIQPQIALANGVTVIAPSQPILQAAAAAAGQKLPSTNQVRGTVTISHYTNHHYVKVVRRAASGVDEVYASAAPSNHECTPGVCSVVREIPYWTYGRYTVKNELGTWEMPITCSSKRSVLAREGGGASLACARDGGGRGTAGTARQENRTSPAAAAGGGAADFTGGGGWGDRTGGPGGGGRGGAARAPAAAETVARARDRRPVQIAILVQ
uniref:Uncharacterized protein n=1 Tax=Plectus sambesii TaxID=2011161 RepID=A0A914UH17_9BILA